MSSFIEKFRNNYNNLLSDLERYTKNESIKLEKNNINDEIIKKKMDKLYNDTYNNETMIQEKNEEYLVNNFNILPNNFSLIKYWNKLNKKRKEKIWIYINILYEYSKEKYYNSNTFNPYEGIYGREYDNKITLDDMDNDFYNKIKNDGGIINSLTQMKNMKDLLSFKQLKQKLEEIDNDKINKTTDNIGKMFDIDKKEYKKTIIKLITKIMKEVKNIELKDDNLMTSHNELYQKIMDKINTILTEEDRKNIDEITEKVKESSFAKNMIPILQTFTNNSELSKSTKSFDLNNMINNVQNIFKDPNVKNNLSNIENKIKEVSGKTDGKNDDLNKNIEQILSKSKDNIDFNKLFSKVNNISKNISKKNISKKNSNSKQSETNKENLEDVMKNLKSSLNDLTTNENDGEDNPFKMFSKILKSQQNK